MSKTNDKELYFGISDNKIYVCFFETGKNILKDSIVFEIPGELNNNLNFKIILKLLRDNIRKLEKKLGFFINEGNISIQSNTYQSISFSIQNIFDEKELNEQVISNLVQSGLQYFNIQSKDLSVIHIIVKKYIIDDKVYNFLPNKEKFNKIILEIELICLNKSLIEKIKNLFKECKIHINKIVSYDYAKKFLNKELDTTMCISAKRVVNGINESEVKIQEFSQRKTSIFDIIFNFFD